jgi:putative heme-binding domain-containing protein
MISPRSLPILVLTAAASSAAPTLTFDLASESILVVRNLITDETASDAIRAAAIGALNDQRIVRNVLIPNWSTFSPSLKAVALPNITHHAPALLDAVESGAIPKEDIPLNTAQLLRDHRDKTIKERATALFPAPEIIPREKIVERYAEALRLKGDPTRGATVYKTAACFTCHQSPSGEGFAVGPDLATFKTAGPDSILKNLFDPNAEVAPQFQAYTFTLKSSESLIGIITREDATDVTLRMAGGIERTFPRKEVQSMTGLKKSLMPEGLEAALSAQDVADLLAYIATTK